MASEDLRRRGRGARDPESREGPRRVPGGPESRLRAGLRRGSGRRRWGPRGGLGTRWGAGMASPRAAWRGLRKSADAEDRHHRRPGPCPRSPRCRRAALPPRVRGQPVGASQAGCRGAAAAQPTLLLKRRERLRLGAAGRGGGARGRPRTSQRRSAPSCEAV